MSFKSFLLKQLVKTTKTVATSAYKTHRATNQASRAFSKVKLSLDMGRKVIDLYPVKCTYIKSTNSIKVASYRGKRVSVVARISLDSSCFDDDLRDALSLAYKHAA